MTTKKIKKRMKKTGIAVVLATLASTVITPKANAEWIVYPLYGASISQMQLNNDFLNNLGAEYSKNIRDLLKPSWQEIQPAKALNSVGIGADINLEKILENIEFLKSCRENLYFTAGISACNFGAIYKQRYVFPDLDYGDYSDIISRDEKNNLSEVFAGIKLKKILSGKLEFGASASVDFIYINGSADMTRTRGTLDNPSSYKQWRTAKYEGSNFGFSAQLDLSASLSRLFSAGIWMRYDRATVKTNGTETRTSTSAPNPITKDYSPEYKLDGSSAGISVSYRFGKMQVMGD